MKALAVTLACILLAACGGKSDDDERTASGQVLEGSISDAMLPLETVKSQPPLAKISGTPSPGAAATDVPDAEATPAAEDGDAPAVPAAAPPADDD